MTKKKRIVLVCVVLCVLLSAVIGFAVCRASQVKIVYLEEPDSFFYPKSYNYAIKEWPSDCKVEPITDYIDAAQKGQQLWETELAERLNGWKGSMNPGEYVEVCYIEEHDTWVIEGTSPDYNTHSSIRQSVWVGVLPCAIIRSDGTVLAVGIV